MAEDKLDERCRSAAAKYLELQGYEIAEPWLDCESGAGCVVATDRAEDGALVFAEVVYTADLNRGFTRGGCSRDDRVRWEKRAIRYLASHHTAPDVRIRFDVVEMVVVSKNRAFIRHHTNAAA